MQTVWHEDSETSTVLTALTDERVRDCIARIQEGLIDGDHYACGQFSPGEWLLIFRAEMLWRERRRLRHFLRRS